MIFLNWTLKCNKNCLLTQRNAKQQNISNLTKENEIHETKPEKNYETKQNFTFDDTKGNKTKQNEISLFILFRETSEISRNNFLFRFVSCFAKQRKGCEMEILGSTVQLLLSDLGFW
jgi:hypothetical protein